MDDGFKELVVLLVVCVVGVVAASITASVTYSQRTIACFNAAGSNAAAIAACKQGK